MARTGAGGRDRGKDVVIKSNIKQKGPRGDKGDGRGRQQQPKTGDGSRRNRDGNRGGLQSQHEKVPGTQIREMDGRIVRFVRASGKTFQPNDLQGVQQHLDKVGRQGADMPVKGAGREEPQGKGRRRGGRRDEQSNDKAPRLHDMYEKIPGTFIKMIDGVARRVVKASGKAFQPNDLKTTYEHLDKIATVGGGNGREEPQGKGRRKGGGKNNSVKDMYERIPGTKIDMIDGKACRVVKASGKIFQPNDLKGCYQHMDKLEPEAPRKGSGKGRKGKSNGQALMALPAPRKGVKKTIGKEKGAGLKRKGKFLEGVVKKRRRGERKELTPEQKEQRKERFEKRHAARIEKEGRSVVSDVEYEGEIAFRSKGCAWVKPSKPSSFPSDVAAKLKSMNNEIRAKASKGGDKKKQKESPFAGEDLVFISLGDVSDGTILKSGMKVSFKLYTDDKGVGGCNVAEV